MRKLLIALLLLIGCTSGRQAPSPVAPTATAETPAVPAGHGFTVEEEARILALEDRREFDPALVAAWSAHPNALHRNRLALALGRIGAHAFADANRNGEKEADERQAGVAELIELAADADANVRTTVAFALGEIGDPSGSEALFTLATDSNASVAAEAAEALAKMAAQVPLQRYSELTRSGAEGVRARAIRFLFRFDTDQASALAASLLGETSHVLRLEATYALARRAYRPARERLEQLLGDTNTDIRVYAAAALGRIAAVESAPPLLLALSDLHPWVRTNAAVALARIAAKDASYIRGEDLPRLLAVTEDPDPGTRASAIDTLGYYATRNETAKKRLREIASNGTRWERELAAGAIAKHFGDTDLSLLPGELTAWAKVRVLEAAAQLAKNGAAIRRRFAKETDTLVRLNLLGSIPDGEVDGEMELIRPALTDPDPIVRATALDRYSVSKAGDKLEVFRAAEERARGDRENDARLAAIRGIAEIDHPEREAFVRGLLADRDLVVRRTAADIVQETLKKNRPQYTPLPVERDWAQIARWARQPHTATIHMTRGVIELALLPQDAPITTWNFAELARSKYFDNTSFMRVVPNFVIQGGDPRNDQNGGPGFAIRDEINLQKYTRGAVGMALSGPDTGGSQFFITHSAQPHLDGGYTIFGRVYSGMNAVVDQTERGDRVETIAIDEHPPVPAADLLENQKTPGPVKVGRATTEWILQNLPEYGERAREYRPDAAVVEMIADTMKPQDHIEVYMGTWCPDSIREVPKLLKIEDVLKEKYGKTIPLQFVAVDKSKSKPEDLLAGKNVQKVATFIYYRGDRELGRIEERPAGLFEDDLLVIVAR
jgi:cyclophilin family peptidyl-prolyl cis-trans isomerase/HEAT repeat protein